MAQIMSNHYERMCRMQEHQWKNWIFWGLGALAILWIASTFFSGWHYGGGWGMMNSEMTGNWHRGEMGAYMGGPMRGNWGFGPFGLLLGLVGMSFRFGILALILLGGFWLFHRLGGSQGISSLFAPMSAQATCANCGQVVQSNWRNCPHCGVPLAHATHEASGSEDTPPTEGVQA
jgi:hypothetical protein